MSSYSTLVAPWLGAAVDAHKARRWNLAPECTVYPDDRFFAWARNLVDDHDEQLCEFVQKADAADMEALIADLHDKRWPAHRRAFFTALHEMVREKESAALYASAAFAAFYRERYNPAHYFKCEIAALVFPKNPVPASKPPSPPLSVLPPLPESDDESKDDE